MVSEIIGIVLYFILSSVYFYLTKLLLILIILPIILLIATFSPSMPNKTKKFILYFNMFYSLLLLFIPELLPIILNYWKILNNMYMTSYFSIFVLILAEIFVLFIKIYIIFVDIYAIIVIISFIMIVLYGFNVIPNLKEYIKYINNNKKFFRLTLLISPISVISGLIFLFFILPTHSSYYIYLFFLSILLIAAILSYILLFSLKFNLKNMIKILSKLSEDNIDMITLWSSILLLSFSKVEESITNIFALHSTAYSLFTSGIIVIIIFFLMLIMSSYVYVININKSIENNTNKNTEKLAKWTVVTGFSISLLAVYLFGNRSILYIIMGIIIFFILIFIYRYVHSCILNNINKKFWNDILSIILAAYIISSTILYPVVEVLYLAIIYVLLTVIPLFFYCLLKINKEKDYNKQ